MKKRTRARLLALGALVFFVTALPGMTVEMNPAGTPPDAKRIKDIKAYCVDFNWEKPYGRPRLARLGAFADSDPARHFAWYKMLGVNVIQTICVSPCRQKWRRNPWTF